MLSQEFIEKTIREALENVCGISDIESDVSLLEKEIAIHPANFVYIFDILEEKLGLPIHNILTDRTFEVMTVANLTNALLDLNDRKGNE